MSFTEPKSREQTILNYERAARGEVDLHLFKSANHDGILMTTVVVEPVGAPLPENFDNGLGEAINESYEVYHAGIASPEEAARVAAEMRFVDLAESELL